MLSRWPPSAAQTGRAVFPHPAFTKTQFAAAPAIHAPEAAPEDTAVREGVAAIYERRAARETSLMAENLFHAAAAAARQESSGD